MSRRTTEELITDANTKHKILLSGEQSYLSAEMMELPRNHLMSPLKKKQKVLQSLADRIAAHMLREDEDYGFYKDPIVLRDAVRSRYAGKLRFGDL
jgi:hypothetical protein